MSIGGWDINRFKQELNDVAMQFYLFGCQTTRSQQSLPRKKKVWINLTLKLKLAFRQLWWCCWSLVFCLKIWTWIYTENNTIIEINHSHRFSRKGFSLVLLAQVSKQILIKQTITILVIPLNRAKYKCKSIKVTLVQLGLQNQPTYKFIMLVEFLLFNQLFPHEFQSFLSDSSFLKIIIKPNNHKISLYSYSVYIWLAFISFVTSCGFVFQQHYQIISFPPFNVSLILPNLLF